MLGRIKGALSVLFGRSVALATTKVNAYEYLQEGDAVYGDCRTPSEFLEDGCHYYHEHPDGRWVHEVRRNGAWVEIADGAQTKAVDPPFVSIRSTLGLPI